MKNKFPRYPLALFFAFMIISPYPVIAQDRPDALAAYRDSRFNDAVKICIDELAISEKNMNSYSVLGWSLLALGRYQEALDYGTKGMKIARYDPRIIEIMGEANFYLGNNLDALKYLEQYAALAPTGDRIETVYYLMGEIFIRLGEFNHADIAFSTAVYHSPNIARWWARIGYAREKAKDFEYAIEAYEKALKLNPSYAEALRGKERAEAAMKPEGQ
jgi:tetratricopeptide (TPR) repeat protein